MKIYRLSHASHNEIHVISINLHHQEWRRLLLALEYWGITVELSQKLYEFKVYCSLEDWTELCAFAGHPEFVQKTVLNNATL